MWTISCFDVYFSVAEVNEGNIVHVNVVSLQLPKPQILSAVVLLMSNAHTNMRENLLPSLSCAMATQPNTIGAY